MKNGFIRGKESVVGCTLAVLCALFVNCEVHNWGKPIENVQAVFESNFHTVSLSGRFHPCNIVNEVGIAQIQPVVVLLHNY